MLEPIYSEQIDFPNNKVCVSLKDQANSMQKFISSLQEQLNSKDKELQALKQDRDQLTSELKKHKKFYVTVRQQLQDEREFYLKEKEHYCQEITESKKIRQKHTEDLKHMLQNAEQVKETDNLRIELSKLKVYMNETLEANYNLSIKFLRMKNTKYSIQNQLKKIQTENAKLLSDLQTKLEEAKIETLHIISDKFQHPIPPSNKKYLQVVKQNTQLVHENLSLQIEISNLCQNIERIKAENIKHETQLRLKYARSLEFKTSVEKMCEANLCEVCNVLKDDQFYNNKSFSNEKGTLFSLFRNDILTEKTISTTQINCIENRTEQEINNT